MPSTELSKEAISVVEHLVELAHCVEPVDHVDGRIKMRVPLSSLPKLLTIIGGIDLDQGARSIPGLKGYEVSAWSMSATIRYDPNVMPLALWKDFCAIKKDPHAETSFRQRFLALLDNRSCQPDDAGIDSDSP
ncbi:MAG: hypothetical protein HY912_11635 [Desulfomonile tiedjei]|uniref:Uncharacterized protein n=1 Tax=Desulfomonile tiedjei TaxID=2358 RepID=A0A9D6V3W3_9BACT|nr:hypothetical protein [Desulfomonile tiedjei]